MLGNLASQCSDLDALEGHVHDLLAKLIPKGWGKRGHRVRRLIWSRCPTMERWPDAHQDEVCRSKAKGGTTHFFTYATAYAVVRGRRYTLAMCRVRAKQSMDHVLRTLLARLVTLGIRMKLLLLDRGFDSVRVIQDLITASPFIMLVVKRGKTPPTPGGPTGTYALAAKKQGQWTPYTLKSSKEGQVDFDLAVVCHNTRGQRGRHQREALLYATWGLKHRALSWIRATYRSRFGIELLRIVSRIRRAFVPAVVNRPCVCCLWA